MKINEKLPFILKDIYVYDIEACHYQILKINNYDLTNIPFENKLERNKAIGKLIKKDPSLLQLLQDTTHKTIDKYIEANELKDDEIVLRQYDGLIITRPLKFTQLEPIHLNIRKFFEIFISSINRARYIAKQNNGEVVIKGVPYRYSEMDKELEKLCNIPFSNKREIFTQLQKIKDDFFSSDNAKLFAIPNDEESVIFFLNDYGQVVVKKNSINILDTNDIDKEKYFRMYLEPFTKAICLEVLKNVFIT